MANASSRIFSSFGWLFQETKWQRPSKWSSDFLIQILLSQIALILNLSLSLLSNFNQNVVLSICHFFMVFCSSNDTWKTSLIPYFFDGSNLQARLFTRCRTLKSPKNYLFSLQFYFVQMYFLLSQTLSSRTQLPSLAYLS